MFSVTTYLYVNENKTLTQLCCINKSVDSNCKAKCFLEATKKTSEDNQKGVSKATADYFEIYTLTVKNTLPDFILRVDNFSYSIALLSLAPKNPDKPPIA